MNGDGTITATYYPDPSRVQLIRAFNHSHSNTSTDVQGVYRPDYPLTPAKFKWGLADGEHGRVTHSDALNGSIRYPPGFPTNDEGFCTKGEGFGPNFKEKPSPLVENLDL